MTEQQGHKEQEPESKVLVTFYGYMHHHLNLEAVPYICDAFRTQLTETNGKKILFIEASDITRQGADRIRELIAEHGFARYLIAPLLKQKLQRWPTDSEVEDQIKTLMSIKEVSGDIDIVVCRELTKMYEEVRRENVSLSIEHFTNTKPKGEFVILF